MVSQYTKENNRIAFPLLTDLTEWKFNPPTILHMGAKSEAVVKSIKFHLRRSMGELLFTFEKLSTLLTEVEAIRNLRSLQHLSEHPKDLRALTSGHFLTGSALNYPPEPSLLDLAESRLSRWQFIQQRT